MLTWQMNLPERHHARRTSASRSTASSSTRMKALPGVVSVGGTSRLPLGSTGLTSAIDVDGSGHAGRRVAGSAVPALARRLLPDDGHSASAAGASSTTAIRRRRRRSASSIRRWPPSSSRARIRSGSRSATVRRGPAWTIIGADRRRQARRARRSAAAGDVREHLPGPDDLALHRDAHDRRCGRA